ncbi:hypothetical protein Tco_1012297 [Tanacetum coccineum]
MVPSCSSLRAEGNSSVRERKDGDLSNIYWVEKRVIWGRFGAREIFDYSHVPGHAIMHRGRHRHGARATTTGDRINLLLWCRSSVFRELRKHQKEFESWCGECQREKRERLNQMIILLQISGVLLEVKEKLLLD